MYAEMSLELFGAFFVKNADNGRPDFTGVIQEVIDRGRWLPNNSLTILYSTRDSEGGYRNFSSYDRGGDLAPKLEITYVPR